MSSAYSINLYKKYTEIVIPKHTIPTELKYNKTFLKVKGIFQRSVLKLLTVQIYTMYRHYKFINKTMTSSIHPYQQ